jgi:hypothetical protein
VLSERDGVLALRFDDGCAQCAKACQQFSVRQLRQILNGSDGSMRHGDLYWIANPLTDLHERLDSSGPDSRYGNPVACFPRYACRNITAMGQY